MLYSYKLKKIVYLIFLTLSCSMTAQKQHVWSEDFFGLTIDVLIWNDIEYLCSESPLSFFRDYKSIFGEIVVSECNQELPVYVDKNYKAKWFLDGQDNGSRLFLYDVEVLDGSEIYADKRIPIESLTRAKFGEYSNYNDNNQYQFPEGVMFASWFSGFIYIKRQPEQGESYCDCQYRCEDFKILGFWEGRLIYQYKVYSEMLSVDSIIIANNPNHYKKSRSVENLFEDFFRESNCNILLKEKLALEDHLEFTERFYSDTNDELLWNNSKYMCGTESFLSIFDNYLDIFPFENDPIFHEKNYKAQWTIMNNELYLYDITFENEINKDDKYNKEYANRLKTIEKLTKRKFLKVPYFEQNVIFADWLSGTIYIKRLKDFNGRWVRWSDDFGCDFYCAPRYEIVIEKGKIKSMKETNYVVFKKR